MKYLIILCLLTACAGPRGPAGESIKGEPGPADEITVIKLCPGTTTYPGVFVEVALCLENKLYAVYSANNGFLVELVPGHYSSNAIGSACSLTVKDNCEVTND